MNRQQFFSQSIFASLSFVSLPAFAGPGDGPKAITNKINKKPLKPFFLPPDGPDFHGGIKVGFDQVNNQISIAENVLPPKKMGPPPHVHKDLDEIMRVTQGTVSVMIGTEVFQVPAGGWLMRPHGIIHTFWNAGDEPARFVDIFPNQNFDVFLMNFVGMVEGFFKKGINPLTGSGEAVADARKQLDILQAEWGITMYYDQTKPIMDKYGLTA